jgi:hypothetical protein
MISTNDISEDDVFMFGWTRDFVLNSIVTNVKLNNDFVITKVGKYLFTKQDSINNF